TEPAKITNPDGRCWFYLFIIDEIMIGGDDTYIRSDIHIRAHFYSVIGIYIYTGGIAGIAADTAFDVLSASQSSRVVYCPLRCGILPKDATEQKITGKQTDFHVFS